MTSFTISPSEFLSEIGWRFSRRGSWLSVKRCPFCGGGYSGDVFTFAVHSADGNYFCHRTKCGARGSFWSLIESQGKNPRDYTGTSFAPKQTKKRFIYGR